MNTEGAISSFLAECRRCAPSMDVAAYADGMRASLSVTVSGHGGKAYYVYVVTLEALQAHPMHALWHAWGDCLDRHYLRDPWMAL